MGQGVHLGIVLGVFRRCQGVLGVLRVYFVLETAPVELETGRV